MKSLRIKIQLILNTLLFLMCLSIVYTTYHSSQASIEQSLTEEAAGVAKESVSKLDVTAFEQLAKTLQKHPNDEAVSEQVLKDSAYQEMRTLLTSLKEKHGLFYLYTMTRTSDGHYVYVTDGYPLDNQYFSKPGVVEKETYAMMDQVYATKQAQVGHIESKSTWGDILSSYEPILNDQGEVIGFVGADINAKGVLSAMENNQLRMYILIAIIFVVSALFSWSVAHVVLKPIHRLIKEVEEVKNGNLSVHITTKPHDEVGKLGAVFQKILENLSFVLANIHQSATRIAKGSEDTRVFSKEIEQKIEETSVEIHEIQHGALAQLTQIDASVDTMRDLTEEVNAMAAQTEHVYTLSEQMNTTAENGRTHVKEIVDTMRGIQTSYGQSARFISELDQKSKQIHDILTAIESIAQQTHLLSLNASIEAARAGNAGLGFAVVANEVKKLAEQSTQSTQDIAQILTSIQQQVSDTQNTMTHTNTLMNDGVQKVSQTESALLGIIEGVERVNKGIQAMYTSTQKVAQNSEEIVMQLEEVKDISQRSLTQTDAFTQRIYDQKRMISNFGFAIEELATLSLELENVLHHVRTNS